MTEEQTRSLLLVALGATATWLWRSHAALNYVRPSLGPYLLASGLVLLLLGLLPPLGLLRWRAPGAAHADGPGDAGRHPGRRVGWLLLVPVLVVVLIQPAALGSYAVSGHPPVPAGADGAFPPLAPPDRGAVPMSLAEFVTRALRDRNRSLDGVRVRLVGFVAPPAGAEGYRLTRFVIFCCAADAEALQVDVRGDPERRGRDQWLEVEGRWLARPATADDGPAVPPPALTVDAVRPIAQPRLPYEYTIRFGG